MKRFLRLLSMSLVAALALSAGMVAFAADDAEPEQPAEAEAEAIYTETIPAVPSIVQQEFSKPRNYTETKVWIKATNYNIPAVLTLPKGGGRGQFPAVVMLHGTGSDKDEAGGAYAYAAPIMAEAGIATLRIDFVGSGESTASYAKYNFGTAKADAINAGMYLAAHYNIDENRIGIMGWSQGGTIAMLAAGSTDLFKSVVTWAGATDLSSLITEEGYAEAKKNGYSVLEFDWRSSLRLGLDWYEDVKSTNVLEEFGASPAPVLAINGQQDDVVAPRTAERIVAASGNRHSKVLLLDNCDHTFNVFTGDMTVLDKAIDATINQFTKTMQK